jgi:Ca2+-binding EF-hand superfamily protein
MSEANVSQIFGYMDNDNNGEVSYKEFCELCEENRRNLTLYSSVGNQ